LTKKFIKILKLLKIESIDGDILIPFQSIKRDFQQDFTGKEIIDGNGTIIGKVVNSKWNCGIAIIEKDLLVNSSNPTFKIGDHKITIYDPNSLWESISNIIEENNKKNIENLEELNTDSQENKKDN
jgi:hypothetical protein